MPDCALVLAGGKGARMKSELPKPMFEILGEPMLEWVLSACERAKIGDICVVKGYNAEVIDSYLQSRVGNKCDTVLQKERMGTGHAVMMAREWLKVKLDSCEGAKPNVLILCGDAPFIDEKTISESLAVHQKCKNAVTVITAKVDNPKGYGRIVKKDGLILGIVEEKDLTDRQHDISEINSGAMWFSIKALLYALEEIKPNNSQNEYYLTDSIHILSQAGYNVGSYISENEQVVLGANDRKGLLRLNDIARRSIIDRHLDDGVEFTCIDGVEVGRKVILAPGVKILQGTILKGEVSIGTGSVIGVNTIIENCTVGENCVLNSVQAYDSKIGDNVTVGPFVRIRPGSIIKNGAKIGNFVEVKNSTIGEKTAIAHLTYVGDSDVGANVNFGCGVVTVNYDGKNKYRTTIGDGAFIGCNTNLVAPVKIGNRAYTAAGSTITGDVPDKALAIERGKTYIKENYSDKKLKK